MINNDGALCNCRKSEDIVDQLLETVNEEMDFGPAVGKMLRVIGESTAADRCYVCKYLDEKFSGIEKTFEWCDPAMPFTDLPDLEMSDFAGYHDTLLKHETVFQPTRIIFGVWTARGLYGFVGIDYGWKRKEFPHSVIHATKSFTQLFRLTYERTRQHEKLLESTSLQTQIMDNISVPILLVDLDYRVMAANPTKKVNVSMPLDKLLGTHCYDNVCKFGAPPEFCAVQETMRTQQPSKKEFEFGGKHLINTSQPIFDRNGKMQYVLSIDLDVTEVTRQKEELKVAMEQAQAANYAKSNFLATVSHELRTPLNVVIGFSELLRNGGVDEKKQQEYLDSISFAGNALLGLINDVLDISSLEADTTQITPSRNDVAELIQQTTAIFMTKATEKKIEISTSTGGIGPYMLHVDNLRLRQILLNLVGNAIKFTSKGRVTVEASFTPDDGEYGTLVIRVSDTGIGIAPENQERIFEPFVHDSIIRGKWMYEGSGLGLTITRKLLDKMGGDIHLDSMPGQGSTFTIRFNQVKYEAAPESPPASRQQVLLGTDINLLRDRKLRVLLVDDIALNLKVLAAMLKLLDVESERVDSGRAAMEKLHQDRDFDMILTDLWMPGMSGAEFSQALKDKGFADIPIVAVTADTQISQEDRQLFADILYKPITVDSLRQMFRTAMPS